jgi:hypothetical protein
MKPHRREHSTRSEAGGAERSPVQIRPPRLEKPPLWVGHRNAGGSTPAVPTAGYGARAPDLAATRARATGPGVQNGVQSLNRKGASPMRVGFPSRRPRVRDPSSSIPAGSPLSRERGIAVRGPVREFGRFLRLLRRRSPWTDLRVAASDAYVVDAPTGGPHRWVPSRRGGERFPVAGLPAVDVGGAGTSEAPAMTDPGREVPKVRANGSVDTAHAAGDAKEVWSDHPERIPRR